MTSPIELPGDNADELFALARRLSGRNVISANRCEGSGNNRVYRIRTERSSYALKCYGANSFDQRDRLGHEFDGLRFLCGNGVGSFVPAAIAVDRNLRCALYEWVEGAALTAHGTKEIDAVLQLLEALHRARTAEAARRLPLATEAVLCLSGMLAQIASRIELLRQLNDTEPELAAFLAGDLQPELNCQMKKIEGLDTSTELATEFRTLSPSDLGFHNAVRRSDGSLAFIDFEYFGWDDPAKLVADFLWHPAMQLSASERRQFLDGVTRVYGEDRTFITRLTHSFPFYGIRWSLIILNEFLPQSWERRGYSRGSRDWSVAKREQLAKARATLSALREHSGGVLVDEHS